MSARGAFVLPTLVAAWVTLATASTITHRSVEIACAGDAYTETERLTVRLDTPADLESWSQWSTVLDEHIELLSCEVRVVGEGGNVVAEVPRRKHRRVDSVGSGLYDSAWRLEVPLPPLEVGQRLEIAVATRHSPVWPGAAVVLQQRDPQQRLEVDVTCPGDLLRWHLNTSDERYRVHHDGGRLRVTGEEVPAWADLEASPDLPLAIPSLRLAWAADAGWPAVGMWFEHLRSTAPGPGAAVASQAARLCRDALSSRQRFEAVAAHVTRAIRYEAVEIGPGGWIPSPPDEVLARGWGDCKDKSLLLVSLLKACGVESSLVLIRLGDGRGPDPAFPSPYWFNHCIVGVDGEALGAGEDDVVDGLVLVDTTDPEGNPSWLDASCRDRPALVVQGQSSRLVTVPVRAGVESTELEVIGSLDPQGSFAGRVELRLDGSSARAWSRYLRSQPADRTQEAVARRLQHLLPGARVLEPEHRDASGARPSVRLAARVSLDHLGAGDAGQARMLLPGLQGTPDPRTLEERTLPVVVSPGLFLTRWRVTLPSGWCPPEERSDAVSTAVGRASLEVRRDGDGALLLERRLELDTAQVDPEKLAELRTLAVFESRSARRSTRLRCEGD